MRYSFAGFQKWVDGQFALFGCYSSYRSELTPQSTHRVRAAFIGARSFRIERQPEPLCEALLSAACLDYEPSLRNRDVRLWLPRHLRTVNHNAFTEKRNRSVGPTGSDDRLQRVRGVETKCGRLEVTVSVPDTAAEQGHFA